MIFVNNFKLIIFCTLSLVVRIQMRSVVSFSQIGDIRIEHINDRWICDKIECPANTYRCYVSKTNENDPSVLVRSNICFSKDNRPLEQNTISTAIDPNYRIRVEVNSYRNGLITTSNMNTAYNQDFDEEKFKKDLQNHLEGIHQNLDNEMKNLHLNLENINKNIQQNLQNQMTNLRENLSNMQYNLAHMFD